MPYSRVRPSPHPLAQRPGPRLAARAFSGTRAGGSQTCRLTPQAGEGRRCQVDAAPFEGAGHEGGIGVGRNPRRAVPRRDAPSPQPLSRERERGDGAGQASLRLEARVTRAGSGSRLRFFRGRSRPISRVLSWTVIPLGAVSPRRSSNLPGPDAGRAMRSLFGLAPGGVCRAGPLPDSRCALTAPFHPCLIRPRRAGHRRYLSVALSVGSRRPGVTWHRALWSPDFPRRRTTEVVPTTRLSGRLRRAHSLTPPAAARASDVDMAPPGAGDRVVASHPPPRSGASPSGTPASRRTTVTAAPVSMWREASGWHAGRSPSRIAT